MKKIVVPAVVFVAVFAICSALVPYVFVQWQALGLYLTAPDYFPSTLGGFFVQFFDIPYVGPAAMAAAATLVYMLLALVSRKKWWRISCASVLIVAALSTAVLPQTRKYERWAKMETCARRYQWNRILQVATPDLCAKDRSVRPYAAMALACEGRLRDEFQAYSINRPDDMNMDMDFSREGLYFSSILYDCLGCPNEAIHRTFQAACHLPHGTSFSTLSQLMRYNIETGDWTLVRKYADILSTSLRYRTLGRTARRLYADKADKYDGGASGMVTDTPLYNVAKIYSEGSKTATAVQYFAVYTILTSQSQDSR